MLIEYQTLCWRTGTHVAFEHKHESHRLPKRNFFYSYSSSHPITASLEYSCEKRSRPRDNWMNETCFSAFALKHNSAYALLCTKSALSLFRTISLFFRGLRFELNSLVFFAPWRFTHSKRVEKISFIARLCTSNGTERMAFKLIDPTRVCMCTFHLDLANETFFQHIFAWNRQMFFFNRAQSLVVGNHNQRCDFQTKWLKNECDWWLFSYRFNDLQRKIPHVFDGICSKLRFCSKIKKNLFKLKKKE